MTTRFGNYEVLAPLGVGGMASVYRARVVEGRRAGTLVALKQLNAVFRDEPKVRSLFQKEASLAQLLDHPGIVKVFEAGEVDGTSFMTMELVEGVDLGRLLARCRVARVRLPVDFAAYITAALLDALAYAHAVGTSRGGGLGIVHCDVSPSNVFISDVGDVKLGDFGVAAWRHQEKIGQHPLGKAYYLSPEVLDGEVSKAADLWAACVVLYEVLTLDLPFSADSVASVHAAIRAGKHLPVETLRPEVRPGLRAVVERGLATNPGARFPDAKAFAAAVREQMDPNVGTPLAIAAFMRALMGSPREGGSAPGKAGVTSYEFALVLHSSVDLSFVGSVLGKLREELRERLVSSDLYARSATGEVIALLRLSTSTRTVSWTLEQEALRLHGKLVDLHALDAAARERFWQKRVAACDVHLDAATDPAGAARALGERLGLPVDRGSGVIPLRYGSEHELWMAYIRAVAEGGLFIPAVRVPAANTEVRLAFSVPGKETLPCRALVKSERTVDGKPGFFAELVPTHAFLDFVARQRSASKQGRSLGTAGGARAYPRFDTCLEVEFRNYPELSAEYATNISKGGLFVRTTSPPDLHSQVKLSVRLPSGEVVETDAEVVHVVTTEMAQKYRMAPGAGLSFVDSAASFHEPFSRLIADYQARRPRLLVVDADATFVGELREALVGAGLDMDVQADGKAAFQHLVSELFTYDMVAVTLEGTGQALVDQIRRLGGESDLRIAVLVDGDEGPHAWLKGPHAANDVINKWRPTPDVVKRLLKLLGR